MTRCSHSHIRLVSRTVIAAIVLSLAIPAQALADPNDRIVVSLGDSYSSGEGCPPFYGQDSSDKYNEEDWLAHRSENSWEGQLVLGNGTRLKDVKASQLAEGKEVDGDSRWYFYASSGAVAVNVYDAELASNAEAILRNGKSKHRHAQKKTGKKDLVGEPFTEYVEVQIEEALKDLESDGLAGSDVDYVTMSIGGNDVGFVPIVTEVWMRRGFVDRDYLFNAMNTAWWNYDRRIAYQDTNENALDTSWLSKLKRDSGNRTKRGDIKQCYRRIANEFPSAQILIVGYPTLLDDDAFENTLSLSEKGGLWDRFLTWAGFVKNNADNIVGFASWESWFVNQNVRHFNSELSMLVTETNEELLEESGDPEAARLHFVSVEDAFDGHEAYSKKPYLNRIMPTQSEDFDLIPPVSSYSMHPNYLGQTKAGAASDGISSYREAVQKELTKLEEARPLVAFLDGDSSNQLDESRDEQRTTEEAYAAYAAKLEEYLGEFGQPDVRAVWNVSEYMCSAEGVCVAELVDFDADGSEELLVVYYDKDAAADDHYVDINGNEHERDLNDSTAYVAEVWSYVDDSLVLVYRQPTQATNGGWAYLARLKFEDGKSWLRSEDYEGSHYIKLWEIANQSPVVAHQYEIRDEYTADMTLWIDGAEESRGIDAWNNNYGAESVSYLLINKESATVEREGTYDNGGMYHTVHGCIDLTKVTMHRLGITTTLDEGGNASGHTDSGTYILSGTVRVHEEDFRGERTDGVVSIVLDEDVPYEYEYKGTVQAMAHDVLLATTGSETFGANEYDEWAQYDGQHISVECDDLQGAYHDASFWNVDTMATGKIRLLNSSS